MKYVRPKRIVDEALMQWATDLLDRHHDGGIVFVMPRGYLRVLLESNVNIRQFAGRWVVDRKLPTLDTSRRRSMMIRKSG